MDGCLHCVFTCSPGKRARVASGLGDTPAGSISAPAARLSPPLDPARRGGWAFCRREVAGCRGSSLWPAGLEGTVGQGLGDAGRIGGRLCPGVLFHSFIRSTVQNLIGSEDTASDPVA